MRVQRHDVLPDILDGICFFLRREMANWGMQLDEFIRVMTRYYLVGGEELDIIPSIDSREYRVSIVTVEGEVYMETVEFSPLWDFSPAYINEPGHSAVTTMGVAPGDFLTLKIEDGAIAAASHKKMVVKEKKDKKAWKKANPTLLFILPWVEEIAAELLSPASSHTSSPPSPSLLGYDDTVTSLMGTQMLYYNRLSQLFESVDITV